MKRLFEDENGKYKWDDRARKINSEVEQALKPIFENNSDVNPNDVMASIMLAATTLCSFKCLGED